MFTRQIVPQAPPPAPAPISVPKPRKVQAQRSSNAINSVASSSLPADTTPTAPPPEPAAAPTDTAPPATSTIASATATVAATPDSSTTAASATATTTAWLDSWPADTRLSYQLGGQFRGELHGNAQVQWQREADSYQARVAIDIGWMVNMVMTSQGKVSPQGLQPRAYEEQVNGRRRSALLDERSVALGSGERVPRPDGVQDTASQFVELSHQFASGRAALEVGRTVSFWMARPGGVDLWTYDITEQVTLMTPRLGPVQAFHLKPRPLANPRGNITAEMWFAPSLQYLPVRIRIGLGNDAFVDLLVDRIEQR
nr:DUF3108 domain-containing protein [Variovorax terrae]